VAAARDFTRRNCRKISFVEAYQLNGLQRETEVAAATEEFYVVEMPSNELGSESEHQKLLQA
jgi:hypothetical protein